MNHGTEYAYRKKQCRCVECCDNWAAELRARNATYQPAYRAAHKGQPAARRVANPREYAMREESSHNRARQRQALTSASAVRRSARWTPAEDGLVLRCDFSVLELALLLGRTSASVYTRRKRLRAALDT